MKKLLIIIISAVAFISCNSGSNLTTFVNSNVTRQSGDTTIKVNYPAATNKANQQVQDSINVFVEDLLSQLPTLGEPEPKTPADTLDFPLEVYMNWSAAVNNKIVQLEIEQYIFTGGAHGSTLLLTHTFDAQTGNTINPLSFVKEPQKMLEIIHEQLVVDATPLFGPVAEVPMPKVLVLDSVAVTAVYNQYEIAPYSSGIIKIRMPYTQLENIFDTASIDPSTLSITKCPID